MNNSITGLTPIEEMCGCLEPWDCVVCIENDLETKPWESSK